MFNFIFDLNHVIQALIASLITWLITSIGSAIVFCFKKIHKNVLDIMLGVSAGIMIAASFWSLLNPAIEMSNNLKINIVYSVAFGFIMGGLFLFIGDKIMQRFEKDKKSFKRTFMLIFSITLHNIPEGLAIGTAFGSILYGLSGANVLSAWSLAIGIGIQNLPEGMAISVPLRREGYSRFKSFLYGMLSGIVEPIAAIIGAILVLKVRTILPFFLSFAAGAMIYVVIQELIPESQTNKNKEMISLFTLLGFVIMMLLDVLLG